MNKYQIRALRFALEREKGSYREYYKLSPLLRHKISEIKADGKVISKDNICHLYRLYKWGNIYDQYAIKIKTTSQTLYVITKNNCIIWWTLSSIYAPAINTVERFECASMIIIEETRRSWDL